MGRHGILSVTDGHGSASFDAVGKNRSPAGADGIGKQFEDSRQPDPCVGAAGKDVESAGEERSLLMCLTVLGASRADPPIHEERWGGDDRGAGGQPGLAGVEHRLLA
jgi:hypothetical protein